jgi:N6-L-threonylcarbamoyladenine synthase
MLVLGIESSCDETAAAIVADGNTVLSDVVASQNEVHARYGGVVPELASRAHITHVVPVIDEAMRAAGVRLSDIQGIAVTNAPGLVGALLVGVQTAKALAWVSGLPLVDVHHLEGHLSAIYLEQDAPPMPHLALIVSGGHTSLVMVQRHGDVNEIGATRDDAAGEAFDKGAKLLGLGYPGGAVIDRLARGGDPAAVRFPKSMASKQNWDFSFSGLKTALLHRVRDHGLPNDAASQEMADLCASYQASIVEVLVRKTRTLARWRRIEHVQVCGGVASNSALRAAMIAAGAEDGFRVYIPPPKRCTDNAAMIAVAGYHRLLAGHRAGLDLNARPSAPLPRST